jgi:hypothetical protein
VVTTEIYANASSAATRDALRQLEDILHSRSKRRTLQSGWAEAQALSGTAYIGLALCKLLEYLSRLDLNMHGVEIRNFGQKSEIPRAAQPINI